MSRHVFLFDITRHNGLTQSLISSAQAYSSPYAPEIQEWYALLAQSRHLTGLTVHSVSTAGMQLWPTIRNRIKELASNGYADSIFHVLSFDRNVLLSAADMASPELTIRSYSLSMLRVRTDSSAEATTPRSAQIVSAQSAPALSFAEAVSVTKKALAARGHVSRDTALYVSSLRPLLVQFDERARKSSSDSTSYRLISEITRVGRNEGWLAAEGLPPKVRIWLQTPRNITAASTPVLPPPKQETAEASKPDVQLDAGRQRTRQMVDGLKAEGIYSPKPIRDYIFRSLKALIAQGQLFPLPATQLIRRARMSAESEAKNAGVSYDYWPVAGEAVLELLLSAGVLMDEKKSSIKSGLHARGRSVAALDSEFEEKCERYLLKRIVSRLGDVTKHDRTSLAHALFKVPRAEKSLDEMLDRVDQLFSQLEDEIVESSDGKLRLNGPKNLSASNGAKMTDPVALELSKRLVAEHSEIH